MSDLYELVTGQSEDLAVEYKAWMDTSHPEARAKLARHLAALANHGGGYLVVGVDDKTRLPMGETELDRRLFTQDAFAGVVRRYLEPRIQVRVETVDHEGVAYPVLVIPSHGARPVVAIADGPQDEKGRPIGIRQGGIYIRAAGPESVQVKLPDDWNALLDRCLTHRADLLGNIMRQAIARPGRASTRAVDTLKAAVEDTAIDFTGQTEMLANLVKSDDATRIREAGRAFSVLAYGIVGDEGDLLPLDQLRALNDRISIGMHSVAYNGWSSFLPLTVPERAPQLRTGFLAGVEQSHLEGMRLPSTNLLGGGFDYWRLYEGGVAVTAESYRENFARHRDGGEPYLTVWQILFRLHSLLAHARLLGQEIPKVQQVLVRMDWRGLTGRHLAWDQQRVAAPGKVADDRYVKNVTLSWSDLRDHYFESFRCVSLPFLDLFPWTGWEAPELWLTRVRVEQEFRRFGFDSVRLFAD